MRVTDRLGQNYNVYAEGVKKFLEFALGTCDSDGRIRCPCRECRNLRSHKIDLVREHLFVKGIDKGYTDWVLHGEPYPTSFEAPHEEEEIDEDVQPEIVGDDYDEDMEEMLGDIGAGMFMDEGDTDTSSSNDGGHNTFARLWNDSQRELYPGCRRHSKLSFTVRLLHIKSMCRLSIKAVNMLLELFKEALPTDNTLPRNFYEAKKLKRGLGFDYNVIHACKNDCILFWRENEQLNECPICHESRWTSDKANVPQKVVRHFPLIPRLQRLFMSRATAVDMTWHSSDRVRNENILSHPADSQVWKEFDQEHPWFAEEPRNVRLGLATDGFNPFGNMSTSHSTWPVVLMPYNLPPWKCMKDPYFMMSLLIPGPRSPGNDIDIHLQPLIAELKDLWENGVVTFDSSTGKSFKMHAAVLWTINDFPAYGNLSGWSTKGKMTCPTCNKYTKSEWLTYGRKLCFMGHRRFLPGDHRWRGNSGMFDGTVEWGQPPPYLSGEDVLAQFIDVGCNEFGKKQRKRKRATNELNWTKKSIFFELPYWSKLKLRHSLDVMHIEKNICESVLGTLMSIEGKTKDTINSRKDLKRLGIRREMQLQENGSSVYMPIGWYTLSRNERVTFCEWLMKIKLPDGYASNLTRCVRTNDWKITGLKSHDCHVFLQRILPIGIRGYLTRDVRVALTELGAFFKDLCARTLNVEALDRMEREIVIILCKLESIYPPSFFDVMVHLAVHLPREARLAGPVQYRWMYPIERFLGKLKRTVGNKARPEGSIAEAYIDDEWHTFCSKYFHGVDTRFDRPERNFDVDRARQRTIYSVFSQQVRPIGAVRGYDLCGREFEKAQWYVLNNCPEIENYLK